MVRTVVSHPNLPGRDGWRQLRDLPRGTRGFSCSGASWGWLHKGLWRGLFIQSGKILGWEEPLKVIYSNWFGYWSLGSGR